MRTSWGIDPLVSRRLTKGLVVLDTVDGSESVEPRDIRRTTRPVVGAAASQKAYPAPTVRLRTSRSSLAKIFGAQLAALHTDTDVASAK
jgi:hypothetical protein